MNLVRIDHHPSRRQLRIFGLAWLVFFGILGAIAVWKSGTIGPAVLLWALATLVPVVGWVVPEVMRIVYLGMAYAAFPVEFVVSFLTLVIVYYLVLTPTGLLMRLFRYDPMGQSSDQGVDTYWSARKEDKNLNGYFRQF